MRLRQIIEFTERWVDPDELYGASGDFAFVYLKNGQMFYGNNHPRMFWGILQDLVNKMELDGVSKFQVNKTNTSRNKLEEFGLVGRAARRFTRQAENGLVSFWNVDLNAYRQLLSPCLSQLLADERITTDMLISLPITTKDGRHTVPVYEILHIGLDEPTQDMKDKADLMSRIHLMPPDQKKAARKKLGLQGSTEPKHSWQRASEKVGLVKPGQKWWAATSEDRHA